MRHLSAGSCCKLQNRYAQFNNGIPNGEFQITQDVTRIYICEHFRSAQQQQFVQAQRKQHTERTKRCIFRTNSTKGQRHAFHA